MNQKKNNRKNSETTDLTQRCALRRRYWTAATVCAAVLMSATPAFAAGSDPLTIVNNLSDFIFSIIKALGVIILGWGIVQVGMSIQSHDASQRTQGFLCLFGGLLIAFAKEILTSIGAV
ncbi:MAG: glutamyl-tRNA amidotransferase [Oscillospiraceae bacterium]|nr:glutamyl-tRNA amidotransferase [Oscillospiraceae bacterium]